MNGNFQVQTYFGTKYSTKIKKNLTKNATVGVLPSYFFADCYGKIKKRHWQKFPRVCSLDKHKVLARQLTNIYKL